MSGSNLNTIVTIKTHACKYKLFNTMSFFALSLYNCSRLTWSVLNSKVKCIEKITVPSLSQGSVNISTDGSNSEPPALLISGFCTFQLRQQIKSVQKTQSEVAQQMITQDNLRSNLTAQQQEILKLQVLFWFLSYVSLQCEVKA